MRCLDCKHFDAEASRCDVNDDQVCGGDIDKDSCPFLYTNRDIINRLPNSKFIDEIMKFLEGDDYCEKCPAKALCTVDVDTEDWRVPCRMAWKKWLKMAAESEWKK